MSYTATDVNAKNYVDALGRDATIPPPCQIVKSPVKDAYYLRTRTVSPFMVCMVGIYSTGALLNGGTVPWNVTLTEWKNLTRHTTRNDSVPQTSVLFNDGHVEFGPFYWVATPGGWVYPGYK
jgi:hypothetical protein